jgi:hypothetical protein
MNFFKLGFAIQGIVAIIINSLIDNLHLELYQQLILKIQLLQSYLIFFFAKYMTFAVFEVI